ncbi:hypothetical protein NA57DRAFT_64153 [Rhizodiscina lignyota]|uniref:Uncharacterized protein n=1 Tax=Rhizodiscina lignyota TaxID=1504668 RepID=A0A9P4IKF2_9PEZI|nr:hypothetical protein NA57DRAFT_64153 [Rhizodiscina lignyota]
MAEDPLTPDQAHALLDILTHHETCAEIEKFKHDGAIEGYGPPFSSADEASTSPILQMLLSKFAIKLPGLRDVSEVFWKQRAQTLVNKFGEADLSDSYDKGGIGARRTLGTAFATLFEYPARGVLGGYPRREIERDVEDYDPSKPEDVLQGWHDWIQKVVHGDMIDTMFDKAAETGKLEDHSKLVQAAHEHVLVNLAAILHYTMVLSPDGQYLTRVIANINTLIPYTLVRQTLKVGNAATMINAMLRLMLAKLSVTGLTNWIGLTNSTNDGMNLLQQIMSTVIGWDVADLQKQVAKVEKDPNAPSKAHLDAIKEHIKDIDRTKQEVVRQTSIIMSQSIVSIILISTNPELPPLTEEEHKQALEYLSIHLSIRDRQELNRILNYHQPDLVTQAIKDVVAAYDPIIRGIHNAVDLGSTLTDFENFMNDFVKLAKRPYVGKRSIRNPAGISVNASGSDTDGPGGEDRPDIPTVEDYVKLVRKHITSSHRFLHLVAKNGGNVTQWYRDWMKDAVSNFRHPSSSEQGQAPGAGNLTPALNKLFNSLSTEEQIKVKSALDDHAKYLATLHEASKNRMQSILSNKSTDLGPGMYLSRWQDLLDVTLLTPLTQEGPVRTGKEPDRHIPGS